MTRGAPLPSGARVAVTGLGLSGAAAATTLLELGARVVVVDDAAGPPQQATAGRLRALGAAVLLGVQDLPPADLVVTSPGWRPDHPLLLAAGRAGLPVWGEVELAWRLRGEDPPPWLAVTGTNGKTTTVRMLTAILATAGRRVLAAGNVGTPLVTAVRSHPRPQVLAVELSSFQLHWSSSVVPDAAAVLNVADDHLDWHGSFDAYLAAKLRIWAGPVAVGNADDPGVHRELTRAVGRQVPFTLAAPESGGVGVADGWLVDRAFAPAARLARVAQLPLPGRHNVANALAAATLARAFGVPEAAVAGGLAVVRPDPHRNQPVATVAGVTYVDDSKATNPHAAAASIAAYPSVVWIAGGLLKGADPGPLLRQVGRRLRGAVVIGVHRSALMDALQRHAPRVPVVEVATTDTGAMREAVHAATGLATPGDTVLLAPAAASMDMFRDYRARGDAFVAAVRELADR